MKSNWWWALLSVVLASLALAGIAYWHGWNSRGDEVDAWVESHLRRLEQSDPRRPVTWGDTRHGDAMPHYLEAVRVAAAVAAVDDSRLLGEICEHDNAGIDPQARATLLQRWQPALAELREGAHCDALQPPADMAAALAHGVFDAWTASELGKAGIAAGRELLGGGHDREAVEMLLEVAAFGSDLGHRGTLVEVLVGTNLVDRGLGRFTDDDLRRFDPGILRLLAAGLERLDRRWPRVEEAMDRDALYVAHSPAARDGFALTAWRQGFSQRAMYTDAMAEVIDGLAVLERAGEQSGPRLLEAMQQLGLRRAGSSNPLLCTMPPGNGDSLRRWAAKVLAFQSRLRLLRLAVLWHAGETLPSLADPLGEGPLTDEATADGRRFRSAGMDGTDRDEPIERSVRR